MTFVTIELNKQTRKEVAGSSPVGGIKNKIRGVIMNQLDFENIEGDLTITGYDDCVHITCQTKGSYDYGTYELSKSEVDQVIRFIQKWKSNH